MMRRPTLSELAWPMDNCSRRQAQDWAQAASTQILDWTWRAFERLHDAVLSTVNITQPLEQLERDLARLHFSEINMLWAQETGGECAFTPHHEYPEQETRSPAPAKPPAYDIAFVWNNNPRFAWPIEAKVIRTPGSLAEYQGDTEKFITGTAAPLTSEGSQIAYLLSGTPRVFLDNLRDRLHYSLQQSPDFPQRPHGITCHPRTPAPDLRLHHLALFCGPDRKLLHLLDFDS